MRPVQKTFALIPAGGMSTRMGKQKLSLPLGDKSVLERIIEAFATVQIEQILVVLAPHNTELIPIVETSAASCLLLDEATPDMRATVLRGLDHIQQHHSPEEYDCWFLAPADHPVIHPNVIEELLKAWQQHEQASIFIPTCNGKRGHPALIAWQHIEAMRQLPPDKGLNAYFRDRQADTLELPGFTEDILTDLDTPEDYEALVTRFRFNHI